MKLRQQIKIIKHMMLLPMSCETFRVEDLDDRCNLINVKNDTIKIRYTRDQVRRALKGFPTQVKECICECQKDLWV